MVMVVLDHWAMSAGLYDNILFPGDGSLGEGTLGSSSQSDRPQALKEKTPIDNVEKVTIFPSSFFVIK